jgi:hypothetical protein
MYQLLIELMLYSARVIDEHNKATELEHCPCRLAYELVLEEASLLLYLPLCSLTPYLLLDARCFTRRFMLYPRDTSIELK